MITQIEKPSSLAEFYSGLDATLKTAKRIHRIFDADLAIAFNPLMQFFHVGENKLSEILAFFLDPNESHGQGRLFIDSLLKAFELEESVGQFFSCRVKTEKSTPDYRRLHIYL